MPSGGSRPGAGRKPKAQKYQAPINKAEKQIVDKLPLIVSSLLDLAAGVTLQETDKNGDSTVYTQAPDFKAASYLVDRILGKPTIREEISGPAGGPVAVKQTFDELRNMDPAELVRLYREAIGSTGEDRD